MWGTGSDNDTVPDSYGKGLGTERHGSQPLRQVVNLLGLPVQMQGCRLAWFDDGLSEALVDNAMA